MTVRETGHLLPSLYKMSARPQARGVAKVSAFGIPGLDLWFNSNDHLPPHFHAEQPGDWEVRVLFLREPTEMIDVRWQNRSPKASTLRELCDAAEVYRQQLLEEWEQKVSVTEPGSSR